MTISSTNWSVKYVDDQIQKAWFDFKLRLANFIDQSPTSPVSKIGIQKTDESEENQICLAERMLIDFVAPNERTVLVKVQDPMVDRGKIRIEADGEPGPILTSNVDEAAHLVFQILVNMWQVPHPSFLTSKNHPELLPKTTGEEAMKVAPDIGNADSPELISHWITSAINELDEVEMDAPEEGRLKGHGAIGHRFEIVLLSSGFIEISTLVDEDIGTLDFREWMSRDETVKFPVKFFLRETELWMKSVQVVSPFVKDHLKTMVYLHLYAAPLVVNQIADFREQQSEVKSPGARHTSIEDLDKRVGELEGRLDELSRGSSEPEDDQDDGNST